MVAARKLLTTTLLLLCLSNLSGQEYSYVHYDVKDGLAGSTVYDITQDKDGFIWFATEAGVSRFDGTNFKNFTIANGLPETEIIKLFADSKGRVWMAPFKHRLCYYHKGKIYTRENDSLLKKIRPSSPFKEFLEDSDKNIYMLTLEGEIFTLQADSVSRTFFQTDFYGKTWKWALQENPSGKGVLFSSYHYLYHMENGKITIYTILPGTGPKVFMVYADKRIRYISEPAKSAFPTHFTAGKNKYFLNSYNGAWQLDTTKGTFNKVFLPGKQVTRTFIDNEGNIWFSTYGNGVYKMISEEFRTWAIKSNSNAEIFSLHKMDSLLFLGSAFRNIYTFSAGRIDTLQFKLFVPHGTNSSDFVLFNRLTTMVVIHDGSIMMGFDNILLKYIPKNREFQHSNVSIFNAIKSMDIVDIGKTLVGTGTNALLINNNDMRITDTIWPNRTSAVAYYNDQYFIGTLEGLMIVKKDKTFHSPGDKWPPLRYRIGSLAKDTYGNLWVATFGAGILQMKGDSLVRQLTVNDGLSSNMCRNLFVQNNLLWVGTDKGISKIDISVPSFPVVRYSTDDGLPSNIINAIYAENDSVYIASPAGLTVFNEKRISGNSSSVLKILDVTVSGRPRPLDSLLYLAYTENSLRFNFVGISFRSGGDILYRYRLKGLNNEWDSTRQTVLEFLSLPSGSYELELVAVNKFGVVSYPVTIPFTIATPFWQTLWFKVAVIAAIVFLTWWLVNRRFVAIRKREQEKTSLQSRLNDLEQLALRAQMNPHFIFNCLNSIQNFIIHNDLETTNQYLTEFAYLIRQTLDNAAKSTLSIDNEVKYLTRYLEMEKMRFGHSFDYSITVDPHTDQEHTFIPTMILQPYIENSIRHGVRYKQNGKGLIEIKFEKENNELLCIVQDNGIGREQATALKSQMHVEYQSKGMKLTEERIKALNRTLLSPVTIEIIDLKNTGGAPAGTRIVIHFPTNFVI